MIERIKDTQAKYHFPHNGDPDEFQPISYIEFVQSKNIIDILHQIGMMAIRGKQKELNIFFRPALEAILLHVDKTGKYDLKYQDQI